MAERIASEFIDYLNAFHKKGIQNDNKILVQLYKNYIEQIENMPEPNFKGVHHFRSSSTGACAREHYMRLKRYTPDRKEIDEVQTRWQNLGTRIGDMIQYDLLLAEKYMPKPKFRFERVKNNYPHFEEFSTVSKPVHFNGKDFIIHGSTDGIMIYTDEFGKEYRVGLEVKSKQTTSARTTFYSMKTVDYKHKKQTCSYSIMFDVDFWIVLYVNASKKAWKMTDEEKAKNPDIRAFGHYVTEDMRNEVKERFAYICECVDNNTPPKLELNNYTFNNYKEACAKSLTNEELVELTRFLAEDTENYPKWVVSSMEKALEDIVDRRGI